MTQRIRIYVRVFPFYEPCLKAWNESPENVTAILAAVKVLARFVPIRCTVG